MRQAPTEKTGTVKRAVNCRIRSFPRAGVEGFGRRFLAADGLPLRICTDV